MTPSLITWLDAGDRALFHRWALDFNEAGRAPLLWRTTTALGGAAVTITLSLIPIFLSGDGPLRDAGRLSLALLVSSHLAVQAIKRTVGRARPSMAMARAALVDEPDRFSFPSGHAAAAMSVALGYGEFFPAAAGVLAAAALLTGYSRVALAVHYPGDVIAGQALAILAYAVLG